MSLFCLSCVKIDDPFIKDGLQYFNQYSYPMILF